jgi:glycosyltransferase involved in cell wall biosynthesis
MKILHITTEKKWRGGERQLLYLLEGLSNKGVETSLMVCADSEIFKKANLLGIDVIPASSLFDFLTKILLYGDDFDCIHAHNSKSHTLCALTKLKNKIPIIYTRKVNFSPKGILSRLKYHYTNRVVSVSNAVSDTLISNGFVKKSIVIGDAVGSNRVCSDNANKLKENFNKNIIGIVAAFEDEKDPLTILRVVVNLLRVRDDFVVLHFGSGSLYDKVSNEIDRLNIEKVYIQMGYHNNVEDYYSIFDVFLMTSKQEGLGSSVLDAFNHLTPVVSTDAGGLDELVQNRGFVCSIGDDECLSFGLNQALNKSNDSLTWIDSAKEHCDNDRSIETMTSKYVDLYRELI